MNEIDREPLRRWGGLAEALGQYAELDVPIGASDAAAAAVLVLIYDKQDEPHIVLTRRTNYVAAHKGEISLPGGAHEADTDPSLLHTALREAAEEVGIAPETVQVLGRLPTVHTHSSNYFIVPYVATSLLMPIFRADPFEVAEVIEVPLAALRQPEAWLEEEWELDGEVQRVSFYQHGEHKIWGATARILYELLAVLDSFGG